MAPVRTDYGAKLLHGDCLEQLKTLPDSSVDSLVTDPPAGISFMGKDWDCDKGGRKQWIAWMTEVMSECMRVLKPGAHGLVWALPRTSHWTATALEDAGFEVRDVVTHLFGSGFPKSLNVGKQTGLKEHEGLGTALKPASEHWILVRKPLSEKTVAANVLKWGTGALNIDASRVATEDNLNGGAYSPGERERSESAWGGGVGGGVMKGAGREFKAPLGRFPANLVLSGDAPEMLYAQSGTLKSGGGDKGKKSQDGGYHGRYGYHEDVRSPSSGGASRFFYCAKISKAERNAGADNTHPTVKPKKLMAYLIRMVTPPNGTVLDPFMGSGSTGIAAKECGFDFIGIERDAEYHEIASKRIESAVSAGDL